MVHVEGGDGAVGERPALLQHHVLGQVAGQEALAGAAGAGEDDAPVLLQLRHVALQHGLGHQRLEHQAVCAVLLHTCRRGSPGLAGPQV